MINHDQLPWLPWARKRRRTTETARTVTYPPGEALRWAGRHFGPVVQTGAGRHRYAYLLGPEANRFVFAHDELFTMHEAMAGLIPVDGPTSLVVSDGPDHQRRRRLVQPAMHRRQVDGYVATMVHHADTELARWQSGTEVDAYQSLRAAIRRSTIEALFGPEFARDEPQIAKDLQPLLDLVDRLPDSINVHRRLRTPLWRRAMAARERLDRRIYAEIDRIRSAPTEQDHVLATLVYGRDGDDAGLSDLEVRDQMVTLIAAGHETTSAAAAWMTYSVANHPQARDQAAAEVAHVLDGREPTAGDLRDMVYVQAVVAETLRLYPPAVVSARYVQTGFEFAGRQIRPGTMLLFSPYVTHRMPEVYEAPQSFRPERWITPEGALRRMSPDEFLPFGGGAHRCVGSVMATTQLSVLLARLLVGPSFTVVPQRIRATGFAAMRPRDGLRVNVGP